MPTKAPAKGCNCTRSLIPMQLVPLGSRHVKAYDPMGHLENKCMYTFMFVLLRPENQSSHAGCCDERSPLQRVWLTKSCSIFWYSIYEYLSYI